MIDELTVKIGSPITSAEIMQENPEDPANKINTDELREKHREAEKINQQMLSQQQQLLNACKTVTTLSENLKNLYSQGIDEYKKDIAELAIEIARRILNKKIVEGDYDIEGIISDALETAPENTDIEIRINPADLQTIKDIEKERGASIFEGLQLIPDPAVKKADCRIETPKGIVKSLTEEKLERISDALKRAV